MFTECSLNVPYALYSQGRNLEYDGLPVNEALSMGIHESQSLLWERMVRWDHSPKIK
jgi:Zn-dependent M32 family carboxypeptidase